MSKVSIVRIPESQILIPTGVVDTRLNGRFAAQFINKSNSELTKKNYLSNIQQFILYSGKHDVNDVKIEDMMAWRNSLERRNLAPHTISTKLATGLSARVV